jgi:Uma2 family endonuclease
VLTSDPEGASDVHRVRPGRRPHHHTPDARAVEVNQKVREYSSIGVRQVWVVDPEACSVSAYRSPIDVSEFRETDRLSGGDVLPGFEVAVAALFEE